MDQNLIFLPVLVQVLLTVFMFFYLAKVKGQAQKAGLVDEERRALHADAWPESVQKVNNNIRNQFEAPLLFYVLAFMGWALQVIDVYFLAVSGLFVISRLFHAYVHTGSNIVPVRRRIFSVGILLLLALMVPCFWAIVA